MSLDARTAMSTDPTLISASNSVAIASISRYLYDAIRTTRQQYPEWLNAKFKNQPWHSQEFESKFTAKLANELKNSPNRDAIVLKVIKILHNFLLPSFFISTHFSDLMLKIRKFTHPHLEVIINSNSQGLEEENNSLALPNNSPDIITSPMAILLLDAENLQLNVEVENFLAKCCNYPIRVRIAFANWRSMGKQDIEYHGRSYELIHVPAGKDSADIKMATVGASIFLNYPSTKEVLICSSDNALSHLRNTLQAQGITVYLVRKEGETITVLNSSNGQNYSQSLRPLPEIDDFINQLKEIIKEEQTSSFNAWVRLSRISQLYQNKHKLQISQVVAGHLPGKKAKDIFLEYPGDFVAHQPAEKSEFYVTLFQGIEPINNSDGETANLEQSEQNKQEEITGFPNRELLEKAVLNIVKSLSDQASGNYISISLIGSEFYKQYSQPITQVMKQLEIDSKFHIFLQSCRGLKCKKVGKTYRVALSPT